MHINLLSIIYMHSSIKHSAHKLINWFWCQLLRQNILGHLFMEHSLLYSYHRLIPLIILSCFIIAKNFQKLPFIKVGFSYDTSHNIKSELRVFLIPPQWFSISWECTLHFIQRCCLYTICGLSVAAITFILYMDQKEMALLLKSFSPTYSMKYNIF